MPPRKRPALDALAGRIAAKSGAPPQSLAGAPDAAEPPRRGPPPAEKRAARQKAILIRTTPEDWKALKNIATDRETTLRAVVQEAIDAYLKGRGRARRG